MLKTAVAIFLIVGTSAWGQDQTDATSTNKVDRANAYYHFALAHMYAEKAAASRDRNQEHVNQAIENYNAAIKADPQTATLREELSKIESGRLRRPAPVIVYRPR